MKDIIAFDVETTGLNPKTDFIVQLSIIVLDRSLTPKKEYSWYINPEGEYSISPEAFEKHGLTKEFLSQNGIRLKEIADQIIDIFGDNDILTYNGNSFDVNFLYQNLLRVGKEFPIGERHYYDAFLMYKQLHPSNLAAVYKYYTGQELEGAHDAMNDIRATVEVFKQMKLKEIGDEEIDEMDINYLYSPENSICKKCGHIYFNIGKYKDKEFIDICNKDPEYIKWFMNSVASLHTKKILRQYYLDFKNSIK